MNKATFLLLLVSSTLFSYAQNTAAPDVDTTTIAFSSDTQAPMWIETLWLKKTNNKIATKQLFHDIGSRRPGSLFILGDVVSLGSSERQWRPIDSYVANLRQLGISVYAVLGNHEVMGKAKKGEAKFQARFPEHNKTGYVQVKDSVAVVLLNSNFGKLTKAEDEEQTRWYQSVLSQLDADPSVHFIITGCHHSPYTNSKIVKPSTSVQERFVSAFIASEKSRLFITGHCHGFEHFQMEGKDFLVIGGGGGLNQPLRTGDKVLPDLSVAYKPLFHYITVKRQRDHLSVTSYKITNDFNSFEEGMAIRIGSAKNLDLTATSGGRGKLEN